MTTTTEDVAPVFIWSCPRRFPLSEAAPVLFACSVAVVSYKEQELQRRRRHMPRSYFGFLQRRKQQFSFKMSLATLLN
jgi:hypothetical protein